MSLSVLTLNLWNEGGPYDARAKRIVEWIHRLDPDLIGFQEALRGEGRDQVAALLAGSGYHLDYVRASGFWEDPAVDFGNAVASRWPITSRETLRLPDGGDGETRAALSTTIASPRGPLCFTVTHLHWRFDHGWIRERQVAALAGLVARRAAPFGFPPILVGDLNAEPDSAEMRFLRGLQSLNGASTHFRDAWAAGGDGGPGITWSNRNDYARPWLEPDRRIDYVLVGRPITGGVGMVTRCRVVCDDVVDGVWPSDHFGVLAELRTERDPDLVPGK